MLQLKDRFVSLWNRHTYVADSSADSVFSQLHSMYTESWRCYHNASHVEACLKYFDECQSQAQFADAIELAIWFHDCVFTVGADDNEARSRDWFLTQSGAQLVPAVRQTVAQLIMDTCHVDVPKTRDGKLIADIDLTSFGLPWEEYIADSQAVQKEFPAQPASDAAQCKLKFLNYLLSDGRIFYSPYYAEKYEAKAQANIKRHIELLSA